MVIVQKLEPLPIRVNNCCDLANLFLDKIRNLVKNGDDEVHILFDQYTKNSLKKNTRDQRRGSTIKKEYKVEDNTNLKNIPCKYFLSHENTKHELTLYLAKKVRADFFGLFNFFVSAGGITYSNEGFVDKHLHGWC